jgi:hypothetical protein
MEVGLLAAATLSFVTGDGKAAEEVEERSLVEDIAVVGEMLLLLLLLRVGAPLEASSADVVRSLLLEAGEADAEMLSFLPPVVVLPAADAAPKPEPPLTAAISRCLAPATSAAAAAGGGGSRRTLSSKVGLCDLLIEV